MNAYSIWMVSDTALELRDLRQAFAQPSYAWGPAVAVSGGRMTQATAVLWAKTLKGKGRAHWAEPHAVKAQGWEHLCWEEVKVAAEMGNRRPGRAAGPGPMHQGRGRPGALQSPAVWTVTPQLHDLGHRYLIPEQNKHRLAPWGCSITWQAPVNCQAASRGSLKTCQQYREKGKASA